ncbi:MAG: AAA family ATPase, partial [Chloroflexota bacterium]|nr:AAA family ATPase [Chloroflexota bacterium]
GISSPLVGRDREWAAFMHNVERLLAGHGGLISIIGEAGLGKSRLLAEVRQHVADRQLLWREGRALSFSQGISYSPFLQIIRSDAGIAEDDGDAESWAKLERRITALFPAQVAEILPYLATLLALTVRGDFAERVRYLDGDAMRRQIFRSARRFFERLAQERPLVLVFEDLHWADPSSVELLEHLLPLIREVPLLICGISRPDPQAPAARLWTIAAQAYRDCYTPIVLSPLSPADSAQLLHNLLAIDDLPPRYRELILGKAEGNPLFVEEVIRALIDLGAVVQQPETRRWQVTTQVEQITIPDTLQGVIMARVDRLPEEAKQVLKLAAVIGRSFYYRVLQNIAEMDGVLAERLAELQRLEMIREKARAPELEYIFKHVLVQEAAYESILVHRRRELHYCVAQGIETLFAGRVEEFYGLLAYHYARAEDWEKAQEYLFKTGDQAGRIAADAEALGHYQQAIAAYARAFGDRWDPFQRAVLERKIGEALFRRGEHVQAVEYMQRALAYLGNPFPASRRGLRLAIVQQLVRQIGHRLLPGWLAARMREVRNPAAEEQAHIFHVMSWIDYFVDPERLLLDVLLLLNLSEQSGVAPGIVQGSMGMGLIGDQIPAPRLARYYHRRAVTLAEQIRQPVALGLAYLGLGLHVHSVGEWTAALEHYERAATIYWEAGELRAWGATTSARAWLLGLRGEVTSSRSLGHELVRVGQDGADRQVCGFGSQALGRILLHAGALEEAVDHLRDAVESFRAVSDYRNVASAGGDLGLCYLRQGKLKQALEVMVESNRLLDERNLRGWFSIAARNALAEGYLVLAEEVEGAERAAALQKARRACRAAMQQGRLSRDGLPGAYRLRGAYEWLSGQPAAARHWWQRSLAVAQKLGARYDL